MIRMNNNKVITVESLDEQLGGLIRKINRQNTPFYKNPLLEKMITVLMIVSEAVALVATIISFNSRISPLFTIPITTTYVVLFVVLGFSYVATPEKYAPVSAIHAPQSPMTR